MSLNRRTRIAVLQRDGYRCIYCGRSARETVLEVDHVIPRAMGGRDLSTNLVTACRDCNGGKSDILIALPEGFTPEPVGLIRRDRMPTPPSAAGDAPKWLAWCSDGCFSCPFDHYEKGCAITLPVSLIDGDSRSICLSYRCPCGHQWHCWWEPWLARAHNDAVQYEKRTQAIPTFPARPGWMS